MNQGIKVGAYVLERQLGEGGQGSVWQASQPGEPGARPVALKVIPIRGSSPVTLERLRREAQALVRLSSGHPSLVGCHGVIEDATLGVMAIVMDKVEGVDLQAAMTDPRCADEAKALMLTHVARALAHLHEAGVVHRDIKPQNILITHGFFANPSDEATVKVVDFGIAIIAGNPKPLTEIGTVIGTPAYMSPERIDPLFWQARPGLPSEDVWAFGVVAYEAFFGRHPTGVGEEGLLSDYAERYRSASRNYEPWPPVAPTHPWEATLRGVLALRAADRLPSGAAIVAAINGRRVPVTLNDPVPRHTAAQPPAAFAFQATPTPPPASGAGFGLQPSATPPPASVAGSGAPPPVVRTEVNPAFEPRAGSGAALAGGWGTSPAPPPVYHTPSAPGVTPYGPAGAAYAPVVAYGAPPAPPQSSSRGGKRSPFLTALLTGAAGLTVVGLTMFGIRLMDNEPEPPVDDNHPPPRLIDTATPPPSSPTVALPIIPPPEPPPRNPPAVPVTRPPPRPNPQPGTAGAGPVPVIVGPTPQNPPPQNPPPQTTTPLPFPFPIPLPQTPPQNPP
ncbi:MAG TPA: protein kinase, partial [Polyangiaceae bacterium]|nr:protein kinase [Polyangiaceae bacterium]